MSPTSVNTGPCTVPEVGRGCTPPLGVASAVTRLRRTLLQLLPLILAWPELAVAGDVLGPYQRQDVALPEEFSQTPARTVSLGDADGDGLVDLLVATDDNRVCLVTQNRTAGFAAAPPLAYRLPDDTLWYAFIPLQKKRFSLVYCGRDALWQCTVEEQRWSTAERLAPLAGLPAGRIGDAARLAAAGLPWCPPGHVPVLGATALRFLPGNPADSALPLTVAAQVGVEVRAAPWGVSGGWGPFALCVEQRIMLPADSAASPPVDPAFLDLQLKRYKESRGATFHSFHDLGGDPAPDLIIYSYHWGIDPKTTLVIFFRQTDGTFRTEPDQVLRTRGLPAEWNHAKSAGFVSPFRDVNGDGRGDLLLVEVDTHAITAQTLVKAFIDEALHWQLTIRLARQDRSLPQRADVEVGFSGLPPFFDEDARMVRLDGDFNGDGRPDPLVRSALETLEVFLSQDSPRLFAEPSALHFTVPYQGDKQVADLNADHLADLVLTDRKTGAVTVYLSRPAGRRIAP